MARRSRNYMRLVEANLREIIREATRLSEDHDYDITPSDAYGILISARRAMAALTGEPDAIKPKRFVQTDTVDGG